MLWMKQNCHPVSEVNSFINEIVKMAVAPIAVSWEKIVLDVSEINNIYIQMLVDEEDGTFLKAFRDLVAMATEAREEQKRRVIINQWDDEDWWLSDWVTELSHWAVWLSDWVTTIVQSGALEIFWKIIKEYFIFILMSDLFL